MKKLYLSILALVIFASLLMAQVQSEPSEIVGYVNYECVATGTGGNNLIALAMENEYLMASDLGNAYAGQIDAISRWLPEDQAWASASLVGTTWFGDFALEQGNGYFVNVLSTINFYSVGKLLPPVSYHLVYLPVEDAGNNMIMVPLTMSGFDFASELAGDIGVANVVSRWLAADQAWNSASLVGTTWFGDFGINIAMPLMVNVTEEVIAWP